MNEVEKLEHLSLVSKVCTELENHLGMNDKDLAEFIIHLSDKHSTFESFKKVLIENGAEFSDSFISNLLRIIQHMKPKKGNQISSNVITNATDDMSQKFPGLAIPNKPLEPLSDEVESDDDTKKNKKDLDIVADLMAEFEAEAPSKTDHKKDKSPPVNEKKERNRKRSKSKSPSDRYRSRSRHRRSRSRERSSRRDRDKSRDRYRRKSRDRRRDRSNERSDKYRNRRSPSYRDRTNDRSRTKKMKRESPELDEDPVPGKIYNGKVANIVPFGCFVQIEGLRRRWEGLVHISQLRAEGRVTNVSEVVSRGTRVKVSCNLK